MGARFVQTWHEAQMACVHLGIGDEGSGLHRNPLPSRIEVFEGTVQRQGVDLHPEIGRVLIVAGTELGPGQDLGLIFGTGAVAAGRRRRPIVVHYGTGPALTTDGHREGLVRLDQTIVHRRDGHREVCHARRYRDLAGGAVVGHAVAELGIAPVLVGGGVVARSANGEIVFGRFLGRIGQGDLVQQVAPFSHALAGDTLNQRREERLGGEGASAGVTVTIHHPDLEVDVTITQGFGHALVLEELPLAGGRRELQLEDEVAARILPEQGIGPAGGDGDG